MATLIPAGEADPGKRMADSGYAFLLAGRPKSAVQSMPRADRTASQSRAHRHGLLCEGSSSTLSVLHIVRIGDKEISMLSSIAIIAHLERFANRSLVHEVYHTESSTSHVVDFVVRVTLHR